MALRGTVVLPGMVIHFDISRAKSARAVERAMRGDQQIFLVPQVDLTVEDPAVGDLYRIGSICRVRQISRLPKDMIRVMVEGIRKAELLFIHDDGQLLTADVVEPVIEEGELPASALEAMKRGMKGIFSRYCSENAGISDEVRDKILRIEEIGELLDQISIHVPLPFEKRQQIQEALTLSERYEVIGSVLLNETEVVSFQKELQAKVRARVDKNQKEYILREQMRVIREELGEDTTVSDADRFKELLGKLKAKKEIIERIDSEISRFKSLPSQSPESAVERGYIETLLAMPWEKCSRDNNDLKRAKQILDRDHYGLDDVKDRIIEYLAVRILTKKGTSPILCLVGPPGTGKTSIGRSIAEALNKKYVRLSLGGVRDEAEIRGHRRTYVGAMPGRIAASLRKVGVKNPLMVLDEIDKLSSDYKGDTASALLEVLDSEQNTHFEDHYLDLPLDLSEVLFICTANYEQNIPRPLLDRMEIIEVNSYTDNEKAHIARRHLIPKQKKLNGLKEDQLIIRDAALEAIIMKYTREAGVRTLERRIGEICRKSARRILEEKCGQVVVTSRNLSSFLGNERYSIDPANAEDAVGIVRGLAWTAVGGVTLQVEVNVMPGTGDMALTGMIGDVMKESASAGISYLRSIGEGVGLDAEFLRKRDIHIHIPEGAVPKDGPSAGITMATAVFSAVTGLPARADTAMTGEITLRGRVLPIGGLKEKLLAARQAGIRKVLVPEKNRNDVKKISREITGGMEIVFVSDMETVLKEALVYEGDFWTAAGRLARERAEAAKEAAQEKEEA